MTVYMVAQVQILDPEQWEHYKEIAAKEKPPACYRASWQLPGPDFHRQATTSLRTRRNTTNYVTVPPPVLLGARENLNVQSCGGYPADPAPAMVEVFSRKDER